MKVRIISGTIIAVVMFALVWIGGGVLALSLCAISVIAYLELTKATGVTANKNKDEINLLQWIMIGVIVLYYAILFLAGDFMFMMLLVVCSLLLLMVSYVFTYPKYSAEQVMHAYFCFVYGPVMLSFVLLTRMMSNEHDTATHIIGFFAVWMIYISAWVSDTCAYFVGVLFGKHKVTPKLSPKKSLEGCIGGVVGSALAGLLYAILLSKFGDIKEELIPVFVLLGACGSITGQVGDLAASAIKRHYNIKDYGKILPGHGGIMDRFDSVIFTSPFIYLLAVCFFG